MPPLHLKDKILVHLQCPQFTDGLSGAMDHAILHRPRARRTVDITPPIKGFPIEQRLKAILGINRTEDEEAYEEKSANHRPSVVYFLMLDKPGV
jgi:hypothetical protein